MNWLLGLFCRFPVRSRLAHLVTMNTHPAKKTRSGLLHQIAHRFGLNGGFVDHEHDADGVWWIGFRCATCGQLQDAQRSAFQDQPEIRTMPQSPGFTPSKHHTPTDNTHT